MKIATLSIGDELLWGEVVDTNAGTIARALVDMGLTVARHLAVGDREEEIVAALRLLAGEHGVVIVSGGLGPTADDLTARAAARAAGQRLVLNETALAHLRTFHGKLHDPQRPDCDKQALLPAKAAIIPNRWGTACGFRLEIDGSSCFFLPGVPAEMAPMLRETVLPALRELAPATAFLRTKVLTVFGPAEPEVDRLLAGVTEPFAGVSLAFCVDFPEIQVKLRAAGKHGPTVEQTLAQAAAEVRRRLGEVVVAEDGETLDTAVASLLRERGTTLALAESCTGGLVAQRLTAIPGSSAYFLAGFVTYADHAKESLLGVPGEILAAHGAVSGEVAKALARGARTRAGSDLALAVTGIAGPDGGTPDKPVGTVYLALADRTGCWVKRYRFAGSRGEIRALTACTALDWLRRHLRHPGQSRAAEAGP